MGIRKPHRAGSKDKQQCKYCKQLAVKSVLFSDGSAHIPICSAHEGVARAFLRKHGEGVTDIVAVTDRPHVYGESDPILQMALEKPGENSHFGARVLGARRDSAMAEAPVTAPSKPVTNPGSYMQPYKAPRTPTGTIGKGPETFLSALGTDWKNMRLTRVTSNRMNVHVDGQRYTVYSRRG